MKLVVNRLWKKDTYTIGKLYLNGEYICDTLEDKDRGLKQSMLKNDIAKIKIMHQTAIPTGTYKVDLDTFSPKFGYQDFCKKVCNGKVPRLKNVPGYEGVLIHVGNKAEHTSGCILVGYNKIKGGLTNSQDCFKLLYNKIKGDPELTIEII